MSGGVERVERCNGLFRCCCQSCPSERGAGVEGIVLHAELIFSFFFVFFEWKQTEKLEDTLFFGHRCLWLCFLAESVCRSLSSLEVWVLRFWFR